MSIMQPSEQQSNPGINIASEFGVVDVVKVLAKRKSILIGLPIIFAVCTALISSSMPNIYKSTTTILPREQTQANVAAMLTQLGALGGGLSIQIPIDPNTRIPADLYIGMLKSRSVLDNLIHRLDLKKVYATQSDEVARRVLGASSTIKPGKGGLIEIEVEDIDSKRAAQIANAYVDELLRLVKALGLTSASQRRIFFERQLRMTEENLAAAKVSLSTKSNANTVINEKAVNIEATARLRAQISAKELQLNSMQAFANPSNQEYGWGQQELAKMRTELARYELGNEVAVGGLHKQNTQRMRYQPLLEVKYYEALTELIAKQYDLARLDDAKDSSIIQVLDKAVEPDAPLKPRRAVMVFSAALFGLCFAIFAVYAFDIMRVGRFFIAKK